MSTCVAVVEEVNFVHAGAEGQPSARRCMLCNSRSDGFQGAVVRRGDVRRRGERAAVGCRRSTI
eukprot:363159-Chlamydomonas_euryale.AAC.3